ncbi:MAG TPA: orotate phosphoribosyltransferase [Burkholderiales bacterium]|nr:orotate phosphoribosyltransferase [Burkholderiales bacterium]
MFDFRHQFLRFAIEQDVLRFGEFQTKAGRISPYFFNAGLFADGTALKQLGEFYAKAIVAAGIEYDVLFGPAYKGIPLVASTAIALAGSGRSVPYSFNRKEAKDHGEGGNIVGAPLHGRILIIDDVISAGTSVRESIELIRGHGAEPAGVIIAIDRKERGLGNLSAAQETMAQYNIPVFAIATLDDLLAYLQTDVNMEQYAIAIARYRATYGILSL